MKLKSEIANRMKIESSDQLQVFYVNEELTDDHITVNDCGIKNGSTVRVENNPG